MKKRRKSLIKPRTKAFIKQNGLCYYCNNPMWNTKPSELLSKYNIADDEIFNFQCTGEHLIPHCKGGPANQRNIVAACLFCNSKRHQRKNPQNNKKYQRFVQNRIKSGKWNCSLISEV